jgi:NADH-quinone oxidoreductase subunit M
MILLALILFPLLSGLLVLATNSAQARKMALAASLLELLLAGFALHLFKSGHHPELLQTNIRWIDSLNVRLALGVDGISILLVMLTAFLVPFIILSSFNRKYANANVFYALILFMQMALIGVFAALDGFLFYIFWELALIPIWFICLLWGSGDAGKITFKFFIYTLLGSLFMLVGLIFLYQHSGIDGASKSFAIDALYKAGASLTVNQQGFVFWCFFLAFAIKMPIFPFHTWQPDTYTSSPTPGTMLLSGIMLKMGTYGLIRWLLPVVPAGMQEWGGLAIALSVIGILYASCLAIAQKDFKRLIAYSSIAHVGLIAAGILTFTFQGIQGAVVQMLSHGVNVVGLFFIVDILQTRMQTRDIASLGGIRNAAPKFAVLFLIVLLGSVALPFTNGFVGEFLLINGVYQYGVWTAVFAGLTVILGAVYMLRSYQGIMLGEATAKTALFPELTANEKWVLIPLVLVILFFGVYPAPILEIAEPTVKILIEKYNVALP